MNDIGLSISKAIKENKWLSIKYKNSLNEITYYWVSIWDVTKDGKLKVYIYNDKKSNKAIYGTITFENILSCDVLELTCETKNPKLIEKLEKNPKDFEFLKFDRFSMNLLYYLKKCYENDNDPSLDSNVLLPGIDLDKLAKNKHIKLNEEQEEKIIQLIKNNNYEKDNFEEKSLCMSRLSIDRRNDIYVVCYHLVRYNPRTKTLYLDDELLFNGSFLMEGSKTSLRDYLDISSDDFIQTMNNNFNEGLNYLRERVSRGENISTRPIFYLQKRNIHIKFEELFIKIENDYRQNKLLPPLKAFFGQMNVRNYRRSKEPSICFLKKEINIDQMRVLYNAIKYPVTYVQGPPGTGKTTTIINVIFSILLNRKTVLVSSSNNKPIDGIMRALSFKKDGEKTLLPYLRLGNKEETKKAIYKIQMIYEDVVNNPTLYKKKTNDEIDSLYQRKNDENNEILLRKLKAYERRIELTNYINNIDKITKMIQGHSKNSYHLLERKKALETELNSLEIVQDEDLLDLFTPINESSELQNYFYNYRINCFSHLNEKRFQPLIEIISNTDIDEAINKFNRYISDDDNLKNLLSVFPIILTTNISSTRLGTYSSFFDLVIIDEAGQCNITSALIPISHGRNLLLVGDEQQLKPVVLLDRNFNDRYKEQFKVDDNYDYWRLSILACMQLNDNISKNILLRYHYRCPQSIIGYANKRYYHSQLVTEFAKKDGDLVLIDTKNKNILDKNTAFDEAQAIIEYIKRNNLKDTMIITPFVNQKILLDSLLKKNELSKDVSVGTIHQSQGSEKQNIILSFALSSKTSRKTYEWLKNNEEIINVGTTRAQKRLIVACDTEVVDKFSSKDDDLHFLIKYIKNEGKEIDIPESTKVSYGKSNDSYYEKEFYVTISHFCSVYQNFEAKRNVSFKDFFKNDPVLKNSNQEFDCVLYDKKLIKKPLICIEINGGEHFGDSKREYYDRKKREVLEKSGIKLLTISNSFVKEYEAIKELIISLTKNKKEVEQLSLFD